jgi:hypothetical protein
VEDSAIEKAAEREFLRQLKREKSLVEHSAYEEWMSSRSHRRLV